jgi:hypothetical protein
MHDLINTEAYKNACPIEKTEFSLAVILRDIVVIGEYLKERNREKSLEEDE